MSKKTYKVEVLENSFWNLKMLKKGTIDTITIEDGVETPQFKRLGVVSSAEEKQKAEAAAKEAEEKQKAEAAAKEAEEKQKAENLDTEGNEPDEAQENKESSVFDTMSYKSMRKLAAEKGYSGADGWTEDAVREFLKKAE